MATANLAELVSVALNKFINDDGDAFDQVFNKQPFVQYLMQKDELDGEGSLKRVRFEDGGLEIEHMLEYEEGGVIQFYDGLDVITFSPQDTLTNTAWDWKFLVGTLTIENTKLLRIQNNTKKLADYIMTKLRNVKKGVIKKCGTAFFAITPAAKDFDSIPWIIQYDPTATKTVGGVPQGTKSWWRNQTQESSATTYGTMLDEIETMVNDCAYYAGGDSPDLMMMGQTAYEYLQRWFRKNATYYPTNKHLSAIMNIDVPMVQGMTVLWDRGVPDAYTGSGTTYDSIYLINTDYIRFTAHKDRNFTAGERESLLAAQGIDGFGIPIWTMGNLTCSNRNKQGVIGKVIKTMTA